jgi:hypothetical protein
MRLFCSTFENKRLISLAKFSNSDVSVEYALQEPPPLLPFWKRLNAICILESLLAPAAEASFMSLEQT